MRRIILLGAVIATASVGKGYAQERVDAFGLEGRELTVVVLGGAAPAVLFAGTQDGLFAKDASGKARFRRVSGMPQESCRVNALRGTAATDDVLAATELGLFAVDMASLKARQLFGRSDTQERACADTARLGDGTYFVATRAGLFARGPEEMEWSRVSVPFDESIPARLLAVKGVVYAAVQEGVFRSVDLGASWEKVFDAAGAETTEEETFDEEGAGAGERRVVDIVGLETDPDTLCLATTFGIFKSRDRGRTWQALPLSGLDYTTAQSILIHPVLREVLCLTRSGLYVYREEGWVQLVPVFEGRSMAGFGTDVLYVTRTGLYACDLLARPWSAGIPAGTTAASAFINEPTIEEVQRMAVEYAEVSDSKIRDWRRRANVRAFLPDFALNYDKSIYGSSSGAFAVGPRDWGMSLSWDLGDLVYSDDQTSIDVRSKLMVQLRNDILAEVTRLYFERRRLQVEMASEKGKEAGPEKELRLQELAALIDRLTGGHFKKVLKSLY